MTESVAIVGGGASGTLTAVALAGRGTPVTLLDAHGAFALGLAYSTTEPVHLLNVPTGRMSALPDEPAHLLQWLTARGARSDPESFLERGTYGAYLGELLATAGDGVRRLGEQVLSLAPKKRGLRLHLASGGSLSARSVVLAMGNFPPELPPGWEGLSPRLAWRSPWSASGWPAPEAEVLLLGAGLTAVDVVLSLDARGHRGRIHLLSRRGLIPATHPPRMFKPVELPPSPKRLRALVRLFREGSACSDARAVLDTLRPELGAFWQGLTREEQRRFLRHVRTWFDTIRHRLAPQVGAFIAALEAEGR